MLILKNICAAYGKKQILHNISLSFQPGKIYTIIGKNGSGKSSLMKSIIGLMTLNSGNVTLNGDNVFQLPPKTRAQSISYLSQHRNTSNILVEQIVLHGRHPYMTKNERSNTEIHTQAIDYAIQTMDLTEHRKTPLSNLSGGEMQRTYIAMVLAQDTPIVMFDEPTTFIDIEYQVRFLEVVKQLKEKQKTVILVLHDLTSALEISDKIILMDKGQIKCVLPPNEMIQTGNIEKYFNVDIVSNNGVYIIKPTKKIQRNE
ncbi:ABC transporter ATP-binding protein [Anaerotignum sp. MB30-C6]|uniref:ABC transporter ATP-binding protein n=1 Tax=Anaerotignum sp. MB30-C6 TaxID=3070814 RepID=UPI0027DAD52A|nr:ABC transporter ATP-binding protein [Anaerotignum sp. MB30-C6]WMI80563.1 ABC transporter ATP-binding protein [Anaerotignum sp. MB30-C6]